MSGRPVITNNVGEIPRYLKDGENGFVCNPGNDQLYGQKIVEAIEHQERATAIGMEGRRVAIQEFHYAIYGKTLVGFFQSLSLGYRFTKM